MGAPKNMLTFNRNRIIMDTTKMNLWCNVMDFSKRQNFIAILISLIIVVVTGGTDKAYCGCTP